MLRLDMNKTFFAMSQFYESYYQASGDDSLGSLLGGVAVYRNDGVDELFDQGYADDWKKIYYSLGSQDHTAFEGFQAFNQFNNEYLPDIDGYTELARNLVYATRIICEMPQSEREAHPVWQQWVASFEWIGNPNVIKVEESLFLDDARPAENLVGFPDAKVLPPDRPIMDNGGGKKTIGEMQTYFIMMDFLKTYYAIAPNNRDLEKVIGEFTLERKTLDQKDLWSSWKDYFDDISKKTKTVSSFQALAVMSQFMQVEIPDNALHADFSRKLTRDIWRTTFMPEKEYEQTEVWKNWMVSVNRILTE
ncbi:hypothetical protein [Lactiplantibacillus fabifermentans]|uniref:Uncharacterized protein n=2 Tax=Lactiplantibacillus fabifermentans TaxID=483011 RepID=A0A0R2NUY5_9LACO|nr:hypothetical protein [Lactiplantibacillus fabifermentans]ETY75380.1 hypothetical protein LFAB_01940 [Lactiplantibacillus fabifermentans T30PCM01]KRO29535.1 hypothetical protein DY78_GL002926 [Lactiplantibacillus fabifermentans DSM 21115]